MNQTNLSVLILIGILLFTTSGFLVQQKEIKIQQQKLLDEIKIKDECSTAQIYEFIRNFKIPVKDVKQIISNQLSHSNLSNIQGAQKVTLYNILYKSEFLSQNQSESFGNALKATVINDQSRFTFNYQINITEGTIPKVHQFNGTTTLDHVKFTYTKVLELNPLTGLFTFSEVLVNIDQNQMKSVYTPSANSTQIKKFDNSIKGSDKSLYFAFKNFLTKQLFTTFLQSNAKKQSMSKTFDTNPFKYNFYNYITNIDVSSLNVEITDGTDNNKNLLNGISAKLQSPGKYCSNYVPDANDTTHLMFISTEFIQNFIDYSIVNYKKWGNIQVNKLNTRSELLQYILLDLQYIVDGLFDYELAPFYQNQILFRCQALKNIQSSFDIQNKILLQALDWQCYAYVQNVNGKQLKVMDFKPRIKHIIDFKVYPQYLIVSMNKLQYIDCLFNTVDDKYKVIDPKLAQKYIQTVFNDFRSPAVLGSYFKLPSNSRTVQFGQNNVGLWVI